ncbi:hypothetical protein LMB51_02760, partial [Limosilactobacillus reuteri]|nr:hypothetical protein [Limosilactobacillus reuteri]
ICDPKLDLHLYQFANSHERVNYLTPAVNDNPSVFLSQVKAELSKALDVIHQRQQQLLKEPNKEFGFY